MWNANPFVRNPLAQRQQQLRRRQVNGDLGALVDCPDGLLDAVEARSASHVIDFKGVPLDFQ